ncbi:hypothetical protein Kpol_455p8 [Vanderwaltozyma polyspora DSM 70294]|uniref:VPS9 domain-containing protein n=1 Tax=Vanderwaltozyma polyspora (strain ATCC 22028 / DSM 70294 / BCRC 21397 / CBS 2163 / NBRC 10782 / NRRL Y-8283 / UCD 57-17) TaxID=436907 RepID=A7TR29_VANPO|nr:uncharacterized protein Kpol_455p8 [Vanderwaltozyma polyspora DSM 70294]EDO15277.1 hypothetical protein Kpol_455p8 [Vanderwaltozyma polyspora DSM 70294]
MDSNQTILEEFDPLQGKTGSDEVQEDKGSNEKNCDIKDDDVRVEVAEEGTEEVLEDSLYDFQLFIKQFKDPRAEPLVKYTKSFLNNFTRQRLWTAEEQKKLINDFKIFVYDKFNSFEPFQSMDARHLLNSQEGIEKLIMGKLYLYCFSPCLIKTRHLDEGHKNDLEVDAKLVAKIEEYSFIKPQNLDITGPMEKKLDKFITISGNELNKINKFKAPRDKMVNILNACKVLFGILKHNKLDHNGADSFIPLLIFTILKGNIEHLASNVKYIERFRYEGFIRGESSYYISSLQAAIDFIISLDKSSLTITDEVEFDKLYEENRETIEHKKRIKEDEIIASGKKITDIKRDVSPSEYIVRPLDEVASSLYSKINEMFTFSNSGEEETSQDDSQEGVLQSSDEATQISELAEIIEREEHMNVFESLQSMFPDIEKEIIEDVCIAKKYRLGVCVDVLLSFTD